MIDPAFVPAYSLPTENRQQLLTSRPVGIPAPEHFALARAPIKAVGPGQLLVRNIYLPVDPAQRGWAGDVANYAQPVAIGTVMRALAVGVVVESEQADFSVGDYVYGWFGWQDYAVVEPAQVLTHFAAPQVALSAYAGVLGINGMSAYLALNRIGRPRANDIVAVTTAAGAVGSVVGQLARMAGCRTVGIAGSAEKVRRCVERFGYHDAFSYREADMAGAIARHLPEGTDVLFDNVGGPLLDDLLRTMRVGGRIVQCGTASIASWSPPLTGPRNEREILTRRLSWGGFVIFDEKDRFAEAGAALLEAIKAGSLIYDEDIEDGIERAPAALQQLYSGENSGKKLIWTS